MRLGMRSDRILWAAMVLATMLDLRWAEGAAALPASDRALDRSQATAFCRA
jgi:hypothetical protein